HERPALERAQVSILPGRTRAHRALAQVDLFEIASRGLRIEIEQRALRDREANRAFDVAGGELGAALELVIEGFEHAPRLLAGFARALDRHLIAAGIGDDTETTFDRGEILPILPEQRRGEPVVVERHHDLRRSAFVEFAARRELAGIREPGQVFSFLRQRASRHGPNAGVPRPAFRTSYSTRFP